MALFARAAATALKLLARDRRRAAEEIDGRRRACCELEVVEGRRWTDGRRTELEL